MRWVEIRLVPSSHLLTFSINFVPYGYLAIKFNTFPEVSLAVIRRAHRYSWE